MNIRYLMVPYSSHLAPEAMRLLHTPRLCSLHVLTVEHLPASDRPPLLVHVLVQVMRSVVRLEVVGRTTLKVTPEQRNLHEEPCQHYPTVLSFSPGIAVRDKGRCLQIDVIGGKACRPPPVTESREALNTRSGCIATIFITTIAPIEWPAQCAASHPTYADTETPRAKPAGSQ